MDKVQLLRNAIEFAKKNPESPEANELRKRIESGMYTRELNMLKNGVPKKDSFVEKVADFTGGKEISQGLGQAIANVDFQSPGSQFKNPITGKVEAPISKGNATLLAETQKSQSELADKYIARIKEKRALGEDTTKLEELLKGLGVDIAKTGAGAEDLLNPNKLTTKQVVGDALQLGTTVLGAGQLPGVAKTATAATTVGKGIIQGAGQGALAGGIYGASSGVSQGLQQDLSAGEITKKGLLNAAGGAVAGGVLGGVVGGISGGIRQRAINKENKAFIDKLITPPTEKGKAGLSAIKSGKVVEGQGLLGERDFTGALPNYKKIRESVAQVEGLSPKNSALENLNAIHDGIGKTAEELRNNLRQSGVSFTPQEFNKYLNEIKKSLAENPTIVGDSEKSAIKIIEKFNSLVKQEGYTPEGLLNARQLLDQWMGSQKGNVFNPASENAISIATRAIRQGGNSFIAKLVPDVAVKDMLSHQTNLYHAIDIIAPKAQKEGVSYLTRLIGLIRAHPVGALATTGAGAIIGDRVVRAIVP